MFYSLSNNFGAGTIQFKDSQSETVTVLNAKFTVNPNSAAYRAAETLEIRVPNLVMKKSAITAAFIVSSEASNHYGTILKTWIKDRNTICIEKIQGWSQPGPWTICICSAYVKLGGRDAVTVSGDFTPGLSADMADFVTSGIYGTKEPGWCYFCYRFRTKKSLERETELTFHFTGLPEDTDCDVVVVYKMPYVQTNGSPISHAHIKGNELTIHGVPSSVATANTGHFINVFMVRGQSNQDNQ